MTPPSQNERLARIEEKLDNLILAFNRMSGDTSALDRRVRDLEITVNSNKATVGVGYKALLGLLALVQIMNIVYMWAK